MFFRFVESITISTRKKAAENSERDLLTRGPFRIGITGYSTPLREPAFHPGRMGRGSRSEDVSSPALFSPTIRFNFRFNSRCVTWALRV